MIAAEIRLEDIENLLRTVPPVQEPPVPFPQANRMSRVVNLLELLSERPMTRQDITAEYAFDGRQGSKPPVMGPHPHFDGSKESRIPVVTGLIDLMNERRPLLSSGGFSPVA